MIDLESFLEDFKGLSPKEQSNIINKIGESYFIKACGDREPSFTEALKVGQQIQEVSTRLNEHGVGIIQTLVVFFQHNYQGLMVETRQ